MSLTDEYVVFDVETNGLLYEATKIHCIVIEHGGAFFGYGPDEVEKGLDQLADLARAGKWLVGHNICGFDLPLFRKMSHYDEVFDPMKNEKIMDTYIAVSLRFPEDKPGLESWGFRLGHKKPPIEDWSTYSEEMLDRCKADVIINRKLLEHLHKKGYFEECWQEARVLEQKVLWIHATQTHHGTRVNIERARDLLTEIDMKINELSESLHKKLPKTVTVTGDYVKKPFKADGTLSMMSIRWFRDECGMHAASVLKFPVKHSSFPKPHLDVRVGGPFSRITFEEVNLNSHPRVKELLLSLGWKPTEWNFKKEEDGTMTKTSPKLTEDSYDSLPEGVGQELAEYLKLCHRRRFILNETDSSRGLLSFVRSDGRVACDAFTCGTNTGRYRHTGAFVNLPRVGSYMGKEIRSLFCVPHNRWFLGIDLKGIEARMTAHYASFYDGGRYMKVVLEGDVHQANADALGCSRDTAKTFLYAISYGAGEGKLGSILGCSKREAKRKIKDFWEANVGVAKLKEALEWELDEKGYISGLDKRPLYIRSRHKLLNTLIQSAATIVFKHWMVSCFQAAWVSALKAQQILAYHDELGWEVYDYRKDYAESCGKFFRECALGVGKKLGVLVPTDVDCKVGKSYDEVH